MRSTSPGSGSPEAASGRAPCPPTSPCSPRSCGTSSASLPSSWGTRWAAWSRSSRRRHIPTWWRDSSCSTRPSPRAGATRTARWRRPSSSTGSRGSERPWSAGSASAATDSGSWTRRTSASPTRPAPTRRCSTPASRSSPTGASTHPRRRGRTSEPPARSSACSSAVGSMPRCCTASKPRCCSSTGNVTGWSRSLLRGRWPPRTPSGPSRSCRTSATPPCWRSPSWSPGSSPTGWTVQHPHRPPPTGR